MSPALGRIKRAVRGAVAISGDVDGAGATAQRCRSVAGDWNNLASSAFPPLDCALALDEVAVAGGKLPPILTAMARELGGHFIPDIDAQASDGTASALVLELAAQLGVLAAEIGGALANDGVIDASEADQVLRAKQSLDLTSAKLGRMLGQIANGGEPRA